MACSAIDSRTAVTCSPEATTASYSRASCMGDASWHHPTNSLVLPDIAETTTATSWPASTSRFTCSATFLMRSMVATDVPPNFITRRPMVNGAVPIDMVFLKCRFRAKRQHGPEKAAIHTHQAADKQHRPAGLPE